MISGLVFVRWLFSSLVSVALFGTKESVVAVVCLIGNVVGVSG